MVNATKVVWNASQYNFLKDKANRSRTLILCTNVTVFPVTLRKRSETTSNYWTILIYLKNKHQISTLTHISHNKSNNVLFLFRTVKKDLIFGQEPTLKLLQLFRLSRGKPNQSTFKFKLKSNFKGLVCSILIFGRVDKCSLRILKK